MTEADPDAIGPDGTVQLRCHLPSTGMSWFWVGGAGLACRRCDDLFSRHTGCRDGRRGQTVTQHYDPDSRFV
jgi:hypothetical protein